MDFFSIVVAILVFSFLVLIHELGHFWAARKNGVKVLEFGIGFPPKIWSKKKGETTYTLNWIPFGGFVKLYGEDSSDPKILKDPRSFASKSKWARIQITIAGVVMNFLFALIALTIGFSIGIEPLIAEYPDLIRGVKDGVVETQPGFIVDAVADDSDAKKSGVKEGDTLLSINGVSYTEFLTSKDQENVSSITFSRDGKEESYKFETEVERKGFGLAMKPPTSLPRVTVFADAGDVLKKGDVIEKVNNLTIFSYEDLVEANNEPNTAEDSLVIRRGEEIQTVSFALDTKEDVITGQLDSKQSYSFLVDSFSPDSTADDVGVEAGDVILAVNDTKLNNIAELRAITNSHKEGTVSIEVVREDKKMNFDVEVSKNGTIGVMLMPILNEGGNLKVYAAFEDSSIIRINDVKYPVHEAFLHSGKELWRLSALTVKAFGGVLFDIFSGSGVPDGVAGPVGIAKMTVGFVQQGALSLLRFVAIISLSLAVLNLLPIPALDGGRLLFIAIESVRGKPVAPKTEAVIHGVGFLILMLLIVLITVKDIFG